ncbi:MAG: hypothetical protein H0X63_07380 [Flavobacteriales bacterium]|nr:hypothetical protein [Flavobacteriales bacterium]
MKTTIFKTVILLFVLTIILSCSKDDDISKVEESTKLLDRVNLNGNFVKYSYNEDSTIQKLEALNFNLIFGYSESRISSIEEGENLWQFQYDVNGKIRSFSIADETIDVVYDADNRFYFYEVENRVYTISLYENNEIKKYSIFDTETEEIFYNDYYYDTTKKGGLFNSNSITIHLQMAFTNGFFFSLFNSRIPIENFATNFAGQTYSFENTFDEDGFIKKSIVSNGSYIDFFYIQ